MIEGLTCELEDALVVVVVDGAVDVCCRAAHNVPQKYGVQSARPVLVVLLLLLSTAAPAIQPKTEPPCGPHLHLTTTHQDARSLGFFPKTGIASVEMMDQTSA
jgi:hypothetical protein